MFCFLIYTVFAKVTVFFIPVVYNNVFDHTGFKFSQLKKTIFCSLFLSIFLRLIRPFESTVLHKVFFPVNCEKLK